MSVKLDIQINDNEVRKLIERMSAIPQLISGWFSNVAADRMRDSFKKNFEAEGRPRRWAPLSGGTAEIRKMGNKLGYWKTGNTSPILKRTGDLMRMVIGTKETINVGKDEIVMQMNPQNELSGFSHSKRGGAHSYIEHQLGMAASKISGDTGVKQRQMVRFQNEDLEWLSNRFSDFVENAVNK